MTEPLPAIDDIRRADAASLAAALRCSRSDTLATFEAYERALGGRVVPLRETLNPPLWELGHIGWFQEYWIARNPQRDAGAQADPLAPRWPGLRPGADALYDSSHVPHDSRWALSLPDAATTRADLAGQLETTLKLLARTEGRDDALYFYRLALLHEDMHHEAALYMAQHLGVAINDARWHCPPLRGPRDELAFEAGTWLLGSHGDDFAFDNELQAHPVSLPATRIDSRVLSWAEYLPFVEAGGYRQPQWWSEAGAAWVATEQAVAPRYLRPAGGEWQHWRHGHGSVLDPALPACHLTSHEAEAWCRWARRRLPTEAEWERAAVERPGDFAWGTVWEWTSSTFLPYPGFSPHPYRDYSAPWFGSRRVLRGASHMTQPRMQNPRYRNFFMPQRNDVPAGFRTCSP